MTITKDFASLKYEKTDDPNIIMQIETVASEIHLNKLEKQIAELETHIANTPKKIKTGKYPDEVLTLIAEHNAMVDTTELKKSLDEKKNLLNTLKGL